ncbi:ABC transporter permease, partial [Streptomyces sp. SID8455]|nr:ABC transporter permease [Streptomyces sp. SID8455]
MSLAEAPPAPPSQPEEPQRLKLRKPSTRKRLVPYWLLLPGILWLLVFFALP